MDSLIFSANIVFPIFLIMVVGFFLSRLKMIDNDFIKKANSLCFHVLLPLMIVNNIYKTGFSLAFDPSVISFAVITILILYAILFIIVPLLIKENNRRGVLIQALFRSNVVIIGISICSNIYGKEGLEMATVIYAFITPLFNILASVALCIYDKKNKVSVIKLLVKIITNPFIIASFIGVFMAVLKIKIPDLLDKTISNISVTAIPLSLLVLGASLNMKNLYKNRKLLTITTLLKTVIIPFIMLWVAVLLGYRKLSLCILFGVFAAPTVISSYTMACLSNGDGELAGQIVVTTTVFSALTIFMFIFLGKTLMLL